MPYFGRQSKQLIAALISYFERERDNGGPLLPLNAVRERVADALNVSIRTVSSISQAVTAGEPLRSPKKSKLCQKPTTDVDHFDQVAIRNTIYDMIKNNLIKAKTCITPYQEAGICVPFHNCKVITSILATFTAQAIQFAKDSKCGCDMDMVCCGSSNNKTYPPLIDCAPPPPEEKVILSHFSDESICGVDVISYRIKGGKIAKFWEFPWLAAIEYQSTLDNTNAGIRCGGSIINKNYILTAAHCIVDEEFLAIRVWLGVTNITSEENCQNLKGHLECIKSVQKINISEIIPNYDYARLEGLNDIGLLRLEKSIEYTDYIRPICLPSLDSPSPRVGTYMTVAGWGVTENNTRSQIKLKVDLPRQNESICNKFLKHFDTVVNSDQLCVGGERGKDSCQGDSGGPLMKDFINENGDVQWYQEGIVSYGSGCGIQGRPAVYIRVSSYGRWIFDNINKLGVRLGRGDPCTVPNGNTGTCVPLNTCEVVFKATSTKNKDANYFARKSFCGFANETLVCCQSPASIILPNFDSIALPNKTTCGVVKEESRIIGGDIADLGEFPWVVGIEYISKLVNMNAGIRCVGSVINSRYILTVAHCLLDPEFEPTTVWLGDWKISTDPDCEELIANVECADPVQKIRIKKSIPHIFYSRRAAQNVIGLILLENEIKFSDYVSPICLPLPNLPMLELGTLMTAVGWGGTENGTSSDILLKVKIPLVSNEICSKKLTVLRFLSSQELCAGGEFGKDTCQGDNGGPFMRIIENNASDSMQWYQEGIPSWGVGCGKSGYPAVYTRVSSYMAWIINIISED